MWEQIARVIDSFAQHKSAVLSCCAGRSVVDNRWEISPTPPVEQIRCHIGIMPFAYSYNFVERIGISLIHRMLSRSVAWSYSRCIVGYLRDIVKVCREVFGSQSSSRTCNWTWSPTRSPYGQPEPVNKGSFLDQLLRRGPPLGLLYL